MSSLQCTACYVNCTTADNVKSVLVWTFLSCHTKHWFLSLFLGGYFMIYLKMTFKKLSTIHILCFHCVCSKCIVLTGNPFLSDFTCWCQISACQTGVHGVIFLLTVDIPKGNIPFMPKVWYFRTSSYKCLEIALPLNLTHQSTFCLTSKKASHFNLRGFMGS